jgi:hypothetical protein
MHDVHAQALGCGDVAAHLEDFDLSIKEKVGDELMSTCIVRRRRGFRMLSHCARGARRPKWLRSSGGSTRLHNLKQDK